MTPTPEMRMIFDAERAAFLAQLPALLREHAGKWVLFRDASPIGFFEDCKDALIAGVERFGKRSVFLVAPVAHASELVYPIVSWRLPPPEGMSTAW